MWGRLSGRSSAPSSSRFSLSSRTAAIEQGVAGRHAELAGNDDVAPPRPERLAEQLLGALTAVDVGRIDQIHADLERSLDQGDCLIELVTDKAPTSESEWTDLSEVRPVDEDTAM